MSVKKITDNINMSGQSGSNGDQWTMEKIRSSPRTITPPSSRALTTEQHPEGSACIQPTLILKETVQQQRVLLNPEHSLFRVLPYTELLIRL